MDLNNSEKGEDNILEGWIDKTESQQRANPNVKVHFMGFGTESASNLSLAGSLLMVKI